MLNKTGRNVYGILFLLLVAAILSTAYFFLPPAADAAPAVKDNSITVNVAPLRKQNVTVKKQYIGYVTPIFSPPRRDTLFYSLSLSGTLSLFIPSPFDGGGVGWG